MKNRKGMKKQSLQKRPKLLPSTKSASQKERADLTMRARGRALLESPDQPPILVIHSHCDSVEATMNGQTITRREGELYLDFHQRVVDAAPAHRVGPVCAIMDSDGPEVVYVAVHEQEGGAKVAVESIPGESESDFSKRMGDLWGPDNFEIFFWHGGVGFSNGYPAARELAEKTAKGLEERGKQGLLIPGPETRLALAAIPHRFKLPSPRTQAVHERRSSPD